jgi:serine/threonine protein kinase
MEFTPQTTLTIRGKHYTFVPSQRSNDKVFIDGSGGRAAIYKLHCKETNTFHALKVFKAGVIDSYDRANFTFFQERLPEMSHFAWVKQRMLLTPDTDSSLIANYPSLKNAIIMPWFELRKLDEIRSAILDGSLAITSQKSRHFAQLLAYALAELERQGIAHGDIAYSNILFDWERDELYIIDIEDMYHESLTKPATITKGGGTNGYRFSDDFTSWSPVADRFAGAIMISEILSLVNDECNEASAEESYFKQDEIKERFSEDCDSYEALHDALDDMNSKWSRLLNQAWNATNLNQLPSLVDWETALGRPTSLDRLYQQWLVMPAPVIMPEPVIIPVVKPIITEQIEQIDKQLIAQTKLDIKEGETRRQKPMAEWYTRAADSNYPALFIFLLDLSRSMYKDELKVNDVYRYQIAEKVINNTINALITKSIKSTGAKPRYHVAIIGYHKNNANILQKIPPKDYKDSMNNKSLKADIKAGIYPINALQNLTIDNAIINDAIPAGGDMDKYPAGETHMIQAFNSVYNLIKSHIDLYWECHPPYVFHITDGANNEDGNLIAAFEQLTSLGTAYGNTLVSTAYIGDNLIQPDPKWSGITSSTVFTNQRAGWAYKLRQISSKMPASFRDAIKKELNRDMDADAYLFFPGTDEKMLNAAITAAVSTGSGAQNNE